MSLFLRIHSNCSFRWSPSVPRYHILDMPYTNTSMSDDDEWSLNILGAKCRYMIDDHACFDVQECPVLYLEHRLRRAGRSRGAACDGTGLGDHGPVPILTGLAVELHDQALVSPFVDPFIDRDGARGPVQLLALDQVPSGARVVKLDIPDRAPDIDSIEHILLTIISPPPSAGRWRGSRVRISCAASRHRSICPFQAFRT